MITQDDVQQFLDLGGNAQTQLGAPPECNNSFLIFGWVQSIKDAQAKQHVNNKKQ